VNGLYGCEGLLSRRWLVVSLMAGGVAISRLPASMAES